MANYASEEALWYDYDTSNKKDWITLINHLQKCCRATLEYDYWQKTCKLRDAKECPVCGDNYYNKNVKCESHHHPKKLSTIIEEVVMKYIEENTLDDKTGIEIIDEIMGLHVTGQVHYINICEHCHKKFHKQHPDVCDKIDEIFEERVKKGKELWEKDHSENIENQKEEQEKPTENIEKQVIVNYETKEGFETVTIDINSLI